MKCLLRRLALLEGRPHAASGGTAALAAGSTYVRRGVARIRPMAFVALAAALAVAVPAALAPLAASAQEGAAPEEGEASPQRTVEGEASPQRTVQILHDALEDMAAELGDAPIEERYARLAPVVEATHDLPYIAELSIRREWADLGEPQRERFVNAFVRLSVTTYASRFRALRDGMFRIDGSEPLGDDRWRVLATLTTAGGDTIPFEYVLHETEAGWKIVNILADNVSDLALKRAEYRRLLQDGAIEDLIAELERQAAEAPE